MQQRAGSGAVAFDLHLQSPRGGGSAAPLTRTAAVPAPLSLPLGLPLPPMNRLFAVWLLCLRGPNHSSQSRPEPERIEKHFTFALETHQQLNRRADEGREVRVLQEDHRHIRRVGGEGH